MDENLNKLKFKNRHSCELITSTIFYFICSDYYKSFYVDLFGYYLFGYYLFGYYLFVNIFGRHN